MMTAPDPQLFETVACLLCGGRANLPLVEAEDDLTGKPGRFRFVTCSACGLAYQNPRLKPEHIAAFRAEHPDASSADMAQRLSEQLRPAHPFTEAGVRKTLQRARARFADLLLDDVGHSLGDHTPDQLEEELIELDLLPYCRSAISRRRDRDSS